jgi:hypothetical protein
MSLFTETIPTVLNLLENQVRSKIIESDCTVQAVRNRSYTDVLDMIRKLKPTELQQLKQAFGEGYIEVESAQQWAQKFLQ